MFRIFALCFALAPAYGSTVCDVTTTLQKQDTPFDFGKLNGTWYETVTTFDPISLDHACRTNQEFKDTVDPDGIETLVTLHYDNAPSISFLAHVSKTENGQLVERTVEHNEVVAYGEDENGNINRQAGSETVEFMWRGCSVVGDGHHYYAAVECSSAGWIVWAFTKEVEISPELLVYIHNDLLKLGVSTPLRLSRCKDVIDK